MKELINMTLRFSLAVVLCVGHGRVMGQFIGFEISGARKSWSFPFENYNNLIVVPVTLNHTLPLKFILDSGVRTTLLTDRTISDLINISYDRSVTIIGVGKIREINAYVASNVSISLPGIEGKGQSLVVLEEDYLELRDHLGINVHGILGYEFFNAFVVTIDYIEKIVTVTESHRFKPPRRYTVIPFELVQAKPYVMATIFQADGPAIEAKFLLDSGASHALLVEYDTNENIMLPEKRFATLIGRGLGGELFGYYSRVPAFKLGDFVFKDMLASYTNNYSNPEVIQLTKRSGSIGGDLLSRFTTIYDYSRQRLYLLKNRKFSHHFEYNMSGIELITRGLDFSIKEVILVVKGSPAEHAGMMTGDILLSVNGSLAQDMSLSDLNYLFRSRPGKKIKLLLERNGQKIRIKFHLERLV
ncbi:MAG: aspartyl protease family protein [Bacteroidales bacterium]|nr:aspartyl protease family protein [Bacteroidales bacterium]